MLGKNKFTLKDSDQMIADVIDEFVAQHNLNYDLKELLKVDMLGSSEEVPAGYHIMPETGELMLDSEMPGFEGV